MPVPIEIVFLCLFFDKHIKLNLCKLNDHAYYLLAPLVNNIGFIRRKGPQGEDVRVAGCEVVIFGGLDELMSSFTILRRVTRVSSTCQMLSQVLRSQT